MNGLLTQCGSKRCSMEELLEIPEPEKTKTYTPLNHYDFAVNVKTIASDLLKDFQFKGDKYALSSNGEKMFGLATYRRIQKYNQDPINLAIGMRNSYNRTMSAGICLGASVIVCDNLMFKGDISVLRKHTGENMHEELHDSIVTAIYKSQHQFTELSEDIKAMKQVPMIKREKHEYLGVLTGERILSPTQSSQAFREVAKPSHKDFQTESLWAAYNCATETLKTSAPQDVIKKHGQLHELTKKLYLN